MSYVGTSLYKKPLGRSSTCASAVVLGAGVTKVRTAVSEFRNGREVCLEAL